jgi:hypothetical protein
MSDFTPSDARLPRDPMPHPLDTGADDDLLLRQVRAVLTPMPEVDRRAIASIMAAVAERKRTPWQRFVARWEGALEWWRFSTPPLARGTALAAAALTIGFVARGYVVRDPSVASNVPRVASVPAALPESAALLSAPATPAALRAVEGGADPSALRIPTQFVIDARDVPAGARVSLVGDFNDWNIDADPLALDGGAYSITVPLAPGRHVYAFVVNGEKWIADPRAAEAIDADFGRPGSVIIVQAP